MCVQNVCVYSNSHQKKELPIATSQDQLYVSAGCGPRCEGGPHRERIWPQAGAGDNKDLSSGLAGMAPRAPAALSAQAE